MRVAVLVTFFATALSSVSAFAPTPCGFTVRGIASPNGKTQLYSSEPEEEDGLDLDLEEMFDM
jgi:hypothetical protein